MLSTKTELIETLSLLANHIVVCKNYASEEDICEQLQKIEKRIARIILHVEDNEKPENMMNERSVLNMEQKISDYERFAVPKNEYTENGTNLLSEEIRLTKTVAQKAENLLIELSEQTFVCYVVINYMNRICGLLDVLCRHEIFLNKLSEQISASLGIASKRKQVHINLDLSKKLLDKIEQKAREINLEVAIAIVSPYGNLIAVHVMDNSLLVSYDAAVKKAYTAVAVKMSTEELGKISGCGQMFYGVENVQANKILTIAGGVVLKDYDKIVGGIGVSGGTGDEDNYLAQFGKEVFELGL